MNVLASRMRGKPFTLNEFLALGSTPQTLEGVSPDVARMLPTSRHVQFVNITFLARLLRSYQYLAESAVFRHPREVQMREVKSSSCVLFGGELSNPWIGLYEQSLNFRLRPANQGGNFENRHPRPGEEKIYGDLRALDGVTFARIALLPNFQPGTRVLILTGMGSPETEAAADFVLDPNFLNSVPPELARQLIAPPAHVEILLSTTRVGRVAGAVKVAAWRVSN
jgi:hypothetical protein